VLLRSSWFFLVEIERKKRNVCVCCIMDAIPMDGIVHVVQTLADNILNDILLEIDLIEEWLLGNYVSTCVWLMLYYDTKLSFRWIYGIVDSAILIAGQVMSFCCLRLCSFFLFTLNLFSLPPLLLLGNKNVFCYVHSDNDVDLDDADGIPEVNLRHWNAGHRAIFEAVEILLQDIHQWNDQEFALKGMAFELRSCIFFSVLV